MNRIQVYSISDGDGTIEVVVLSDMTKEEIDKAWYEYYWSKDYDSYKTFIRLMNKKGLIVEVLDTKDGELVVIDICPS